MSQADIWRKQTGGSSEEWSTPQDKLSAAYPIRKKEVEKQKKLETVSDAQRKRLRNLCAKTREILFTKGSTIEQCIKVCFPSKTGEAKALIGTCLDIDSELRAELRWAKTDDRKDEIEKNLDTLRDLEAELERLVYGDE